MRPGAIETVEGLVELDFPHGFAIDDRHIERGSHVFAGRDDDADRVFDCRLGVPASVKPDNNLDSDAETAAAFFVRLGSRPH